MMAVSSNQLLWIGRQLNIYVGSFMFFVGLVGSMINLWLFSRQRLRQNPCSLFIFVASLFDQMHLIVALLLRILADGLNIDPASSSLVICRIRYYLITFSAYCALGCRCLAAFNRCASTSRSATLRRWDSITIARRLLASNVICWALFSIPNLILFDLISISPTKDLCSIASRSFSNYYAYFVNPILYFIIPLVILVVLTVKTHHNVQLMGKNRVAQRTERQLTSMIILQGIAFSISSVPYGAQFIYAAITLNSIKDTHRLALENLFLQIARLSYYTNSVSSFYIYVISSQEIRSILKSALTRKRTSTIIRQSQTLLEKEITSQQSIQRVQSEKYISIVIYQSTV